METGALDYARHRAAEEAAAARTALAALPDSRFRMALFEIADLSVKRDR